MGLTQDKEPWDLFLNLEQILQIMAARGITLHIILEILTGVLYNDMVVTSSAFELQSAVFTVYHQIYTYWWLHVQLLLSCRRSCSKHGKYYSYSYNGCNLDKHFYFQSQNTAIMKWTIYTQTHLNTHTFNKDTCLHIYHSDSNANESRQRHFPKSSKQHGQDYMKQTRTWHFSVFECAFCQNSSSRSQQSLKKTTHYKVSMLTIQCQSQQSDSLHSFRWKIALYARCDCVKLLV